MRNQQLRELLTRIPASPETDELQDFFTNMEREAMADTRRLDFLEANFRLPFEIKGGEHDGLEGSAWSICPANGPATLRETIDAAVSKTNDQEKPQRTAD